MRSTGSAYAIQAYAEEYSSCAEKLTTSRTTHTTVQENKEEALDNIALSEYVNTNGSFDDKLCNLFRNGINKTSKISTYGFLGTFFNRSVIVGFTEQPCSEGSEFTIPIWT